MKILPAIDLMGGKAVRLLQGDYSRKTVYSDDPLALAVQFQTAGARYLHLVDLDGAREGSTPNFSVIASIIAAGSLNAEVGGGIRDMGTLKNTSRQVPGASYWAPRHSMTRLSWGRP